MKAKAPMLKTFFIATLLLVASPSYADCEALVATINKTGGGTQATPDGDPSRWDCKTWPGDPRKTIVAIARYKPGSWFGSPAAFGEGLYDLDVVIVDTETGSVFHRLVEKDTLTSDAESLDGISVDTARYVLAPGLRAFGVKANNYHRGGTSSERITLRLYAVTKGTLKQVMAPLLTRFAVSNAGGFDCDYYRVKERTISVGKKSSYGYADLLVNERREESEVTYSGESCTAVMQKTKRRYVIRFDGSQYRLTGELLE